MNVGAMSVTKHQLDPRNLVIDRQEVLGSGGAGNVFRGQLRYASGPKPVAVKELDVRPSDLGDSQPHEYRLLRSAAEKCSYVTKPLGYCVKDKKVCLVLRLYEKSLAQHAQEQPGAHPCTTVVPAALCKSWMLHAEAQVYKCIHRVHCACMPAL